MLDATHREAWFFACDTVNPNAWGAGSDYMHRTAADVALAQEDKLPAGHPKEAAEQAARSKKWKLAVDVCHVTAVGGKSAGSP